MVAGSLRKMLDADSALDAFVEFMPHDQLRIMVWFNEACLNLHRDDAHLPLARKEEANVSPVTRGLAQCWKAPSPVGMFIDYLYLSPLVFPSSMLDPWYGRSLKGFRTKLT